MYVTVTDPNKPYVMRLADVVGDRPQLNDDEIRKILSNDTNYHIKLHEIYSIINSGAAESRIREAINEDFTLMFAANGKDYMGYKTFDEGIYLWHGSFEQRSAEIALDWNKVIDIFKDMAQADDTEYQLSLF